MEVHMYEPMALSQTALTLQSSIPETHSSISKNKIYEILTKRAVKMLDIGQVGYKHAKRVRDQNQAILAEQAWLIT